MNAGKFSSCRLMSGITASRSHLVKVWSRRSLSFLPQHRESETNSAKTVWKWTDDSEKKIKLALSKFPSNYKASGIIPLLWIAQRQNDNWIPLAAMNAIAERVEVPPIRVYETCSFYTMFNREPVGKYHLQLCGTTPCMLRGAPNIKQVITEELGIQDGETTEDKMFTLTEVECLGACVNAPMVQINDDFIEDLTEDTMKQVLRSIRDGKGYKIGPQNGRKGCLGIEGKTCLTSAPSGPFSRDLKQLKKEYESSQQEKK